MSGARFKYFASGFPMDYWDYYQRLPTVRRLFQQAWVCRRDTTAAFRHACTRMGHCSFRVFAGGECERRRAG